MAFYYCDCYQCKRRPAPRLLGFCSFEADRHNANREESNKQYWHPQSDIDKFGKQLERQAGAVANMLKLSEMYQCEYETTIGMD